MGKHQQECDYLAMIASQADEITAFKSENIALRKVWGERCDELDVLKRQRSVGIFRRKQCTGYGDFSDIDWLDGEYPSKDLQLYARPVPAIPDCETCQNRGKVNGDSQETYCENCKHWMTNRKDFYVAANYSPLAKEVIA